MRRRLSRLRQLSVPGQLFTPDKLVVGGCVLLVTLLTRTLLRWFLKRVRRGPRKARSVLPAPAMAPEKLRGDERYVMAARRQLSTQARSRSGTKMAPQKQTAGGKITDPLWQYAALAVYPERLRARKAAA
ncbi:g8732 [Coccomyxa elongata]